LAVYIDAGVGSVLVDRMKAEMETERKRQAETLAVRSTNAKASKAKSRKFAAKEE
jgi:hypothetical protein